ncbi:hypothetical protein SNE40_005112 [Patella caerulea]|uniref:Uncharacterized protein n=1 Tax=Patella caerulea TaxID=87958 RepID=A0AAN8K4D4_PATCE
MLRHFVAYHHFANDDGRAHGGVSIFLNGNIPQSKVALNSPLQAVAVRVTLHVPITLCSVYLPPSLHLNPRDLDDLVAQLPLPFIITGDFNGHHSLWGSPDDNNRGKQIADFININNLCLLNDDSPTYLHPATASFSSLDLTICSPVLFQDFTWRVNEDLCGSDHFPILIDNNGPSPVERPQRWKLHKADWALFESLCLFSFDPKELEDADEPMALFTSILQDVAEQAIPKTTTEPKRFNKPWYNNDCKSALKERDRMLRRLENHPSTENLAAYQMVRAKARRTIRQAKKSSWQGYVSRINSRTSSKSVWDRIRRIKGKSSALSVNHLNVDNSTLTTFPDIANSLASTFSFNSSSNFSSDAFRGIKQQQEKRRLNFKSRNDECYNDRFSIAELRDSLKRARDTATGPDEIHYQILKHLPYPTLLILLDLFNRIWVDGNFPPSWHEAIIIPIPKPGKDHTNPTNYRPIALTSCICKTMERLINRRLVWYLESNNLITDLQCGFRSQRSTLDHLVRFETFVRDAFIQKQHLVAIFFDLEKAYDTTWKYGIMRDLHNLGLRGRLPIFIKNFLEDRSFKVRLGSIFSDPFPQEMGVPQGSILSPTLFAIKINTIPTCLKRGVDGSLYVDDFQMCYGSTSMQTIERQLQLCLNSIQRWATDNGFRFSKSKTVCMHFCQRRGLHPDPELTLDGSPIPVVDETKFLGLIFDKKLSFIPHIKTLKKKCLKALNILRVLSNTDWGADRKVLLRLYRALIRSKLDYGCIVYGSARESYLKELDTIHNQGLRISLGAFRTSPVQSLYVEAHEPSLHNRRDKLALQYATKIASMPHHISFDTIFRPYHEHLYSLKTNVIPSFGIRIQPLLSQAGISQDSIANTPFFETPPWSISPPMVDLELTKNKKKDTSSTVFQSLFRELRSKYGDYSPIYTDGSKDDDRVASATVTPSETISVRLPPAASIFTAELQAICQALEFIQSSSSLKYIIFTDSLSSLQAIKNKQLAHPLVADIYRLLLSHEFNGKDTVFCWLPSHVDIKGNDQADLAAKSALDLPVSKFLLPYTDFKSSITCFIYDRWQRSWDDADTNKLHHIKPLLGDWPSSYKTSRRDEVVLCRSRIGHTFLTHIFILKREPQPECIHCHVPLTVKHILIECNHLKFIRSKYYRCQSARQLFAQPELHDKVLAFLKETNFYSKF